MKTGLEMVERMEAREAALGSFNGLRAAAVEALRRRGPVTQRAFWVHETPRIHHGDTVWVLRIGGRGLCCTGEGPRTDQSAALSPRWYGSEADAIASGERWVRTGVGPSDQGRHFGELAA